MKMKAADPNIQAESERLWKASLNILEDFNKEKNSLALLQKAMMNILEDAEVERNKYEKTQNALMNMLEDIHDEHEESMLTQRAMINLLDDVNSDRMRFKDLEKSMINILEDIEEEHNKLVTANETMEAANRELEAFSYSVSHDLQIPLRAVNGFSRALLEDYAAILGDDGKHSIDMIMKYTEKMANLIRDLLAFSRLGRRQITETYVDMEDLVREAYSDFALSISGRDILFKVDHLPRASCDRAMIYQVYSNLISNALKFTTGIQRPEILAGSYTEKGENVYYVRDNGAGFDMRYYNRLFGIFERLHSENEFEGTGVGLALVHRIITKHGGRVWAEGEAGKGASFYFTLKTER
jgi:light-regulated signal transduction histidine kinase (bacteriophytochrome)